MTDDYEDIQDLMRTALLEPDGDAPVESLARRGQKRRIRRWAAFSVVPVLVLVAGMLAVPGLFDQRVELAPAGPGVDGSTAMDDSHLVVADAPTVPREPGHSFGDIVTEAEDLQPVWRRFTMPGNPPDVDLRQHALLFVGFGESGSCPAAFDGFAVAGNELHMQIGQEGDDQAGRFCTSDYNPRTLVVAVAKAMLPEGGFILRAGEYGNFALASTPQVAPPADPSSLFGVGPELNAGLVARPTRVRRGETVEVRVRNDEDRDVASANIAVLERWDSQRWLPQPGQEEYIVHPSVTPPSHQPVPPGQSGEVTRVRTRELPPDWYAIRVLINSELGGHERRGAFLVRE